MLNQTAWNSDKALITVFIEEKEAQMSTHLPELSRRPEPSKLVGIASVLLTANLAGFLMVSYMPTALGMDHRSVTIPFRGLMLLLVCYGVYRMLAVSHLRLRMSVISTLAMFFWAAYSIRFIADAVLLQVPLGEEPWKLPCIYSVYAYPPLQSFT